MWWGESADSDRSGAYQGSGGSAGQAASGSEKLQPSCQPAAHWVQQNVWLWSTLAGLWCQLPASSAEQTLSCCQGKEHLQGFYITFIDTKTTGNNCLKKNLVFFPPRDRWHYCHFRNWFRKKVHCCLVFFKSQKWYCINLYSTVIMHASCKVIDPFLSQESWYCNRLCSLLLDVCLQTFSITKYCCSCNASTLQLHLKSNQLINESVDHALKTITSDKLIWKLCNNLI